MKPVPKHLQRPGLSLLEVLAAMAIFLVSLIALGTLVSLGSDRALDVRQQGRAIQICQSKLAEVMAGALPLTPRNEEALDEDPAWSWSLDVDQGAVSGLWMVRVRVSRQRPDGTKVEVSLSQMVLDPSLKGSNSSSGANGTTGGSGTPGAGSSSNSPTTGGR